MARKDADSRRDSCAKRLRTHGTREGFAACCGAGLPKEDNRKKGESVFVSHCKGGFHEERRMRGFAPSKQAEVDRLPRGSSMVASFAAWGCSPKPSSDEPDSTGTKAEPAASSGPDQLAAYSGFPESGRFVDGIASLPEFYQNTEKNDANAESRSPRRYTDRNGFWCSRFLPMTSDSTTPTLTQTSADAPRATRSRTRL